MDDIETMAVAIRPSEEDISLNLNYRNFPFRIHFGVCLEIIFASTFTCAYPDLDFSLNLANGYEGSRSRQEAMRRDLAPGSQRACTRVARA